jgi:hypothetical protein
MLLLMSATCGCVLLLATLPLGAVLGSLMPGARSAGLLTLGVGGIAAVSGIFYPITHLPHWLQWVGQAFPQAGPSPVLCWRRCCCAAWRGGSRDPVWRHDGRKR